MNRNVTFGGLRAAAIALALFAAPIFAGAQDIVGDWDAKMDMQGREIESKLSFKKADDGSLTGTLTGRRGESALENVKFENGTLTFTRKLAAQGQEIEMQFSGKLEGEELKGSFTTAMGDMPLTAKRAVAGADKPAAEPAAGAAQKDPLGEWDVEMDIQGQKRPAKMILTEKGGALAGKWSSARGESDLEKVKFENGKLTFMRKFSAQGQDMEMNFTGDIADGKLNGKFDTAMGEMAVTGARAKAAPAPGGGAPAEGVFGVYDVKSVSQLGDLQRVLTLNPDLTGTYATTEGQKFPLTNVKVDGSNLEFDVTVSAQGQELPLHFKGTLENGDLKGQFMMDGSATAELTGKKKPA